MKKQLVAILASVFTVTGGGVAVATIANTPENATRIALVTAIDDLFEREEIEPISNMLKKGSLEASISSVKYNDAEVFENSEISGKLYFSSSAVMLESFNYVNGNNAINGSLYLSEDLLYVEEEHFLQGAYGIELKNLADELENSIFAYGSGSKYEIPDEEIYNKLIQVLEESDSEEMGKDLEKIVKSYSKEIWKIFKDNAEFESENKEVRLNGEGESVRVVTVEIDAEAFSDMIYDLYEFILEDEQVEDFLVKYEDSFSALIDEKAEKTLAEQYVEFLEDLEPEIDSICEQIVEKENFFETITVEIVTPKFIPKLLKLTVDLGNDEVFSLDFGAEGVKKSNEINVEVMGSKISYVISENNKSEYKAKLLVNGTGVFDVSVDREDEKYVLDLSDLTVSGQLSKEGKTITITVDKILEKNDLKPATAQDVYETDLKIVINQKDKMPDAPTGYKKLSEITDEDIDKVINKIK